MRSARPGPPSPSADRRPDPADASVLPSVRGIPSWAAVLVAVAATVVGAVIDQAVSGRLGAGMLVGLVVGIAAAALAVRRGSIFTAMVQAPLVLLVVDLVVSLLTISGRLTLTLIAVVQAFPTMAIGTAVGLVLGLIRILAQALRRPADRTAAGRRAHA
ncbi:DUF6542 domain-containing protein [Nakamurella endophytica]|uniref:DUF6542 domain-containing protein n=1 Tax=Nakamurella endophytica TaxID=1748367 RepID=UPI00166DA6F0|nr:DUF6542 domain-containing protein [Nakamurella endophytica]